MKPWKVQKFLGDVVYDLRNRNLLPVVILLVVAMVAVPVLISRGNGSSSSSLQSASAPIKPAPEGERAVVTYHAPGLRKASRLGDQSVKNPFRQQFVGGGAGSGASSQLTSTVTTPSAAGTASATSVSGGGSATPAPHATHRLYYFTTVADISFGDVSQPLVRHKKMHAFESLPSADAPVLIYLGSSLDGKRAYFSISTFTSQLSGPGSCAPGPTDCSLLILGPDQVEQMVYSGDGKTYAVKINGISRVRVKAAG